jgi:hypothetical protein
MINQPSVMNQVWENKDKRASKGMIISYVKDLIIANKAELKDMETIAERMFKWLW